jgi:uncharacterized protein
MVTVSVLIWAGTDEWRAEAAHVRPVNGRFTAAGVQLGIGPVPYRLDYVLDTTVAWMTRTLHVTAAGDDWRRSLHLTRNSSGRWTCRADDAGQVDLPMPGADPAALADAVDCDLGFSPLTNTMPILRHGFRHAGSGDFVMAFVTMPALRVGASPQRYEHVRTTEDGSVVRYLSLDGDFTAELELDADGLLSFYPRLARRIDAGARAAEERLNEG